VVDEGTLFSKGNTFDDVAAIEWSGVDAEIVFFSE